MSISGLKTSGRIVPAGGYQPRADAIDIFITDLALHAQKPTKPKSLVRNYAKHLNGGKAKRTHGGIRMVNDDTFEMSLDFNEREVLDLLSKQKKRILRIYLPANGLPASMAPDALEKLKSLQEKHRQQTDRK